MYAEKRIICAVSTELKRNSFVIRRIEIRHYNIDRADGSFEAEKDVGNGQSFSEGIPLGKLAASCAKNRNLIWRKN